MGLRLEYRSGMIFTVAFIVIGPPHHGDEPNYFKRLESRRAELCYPTPVAAAAHAPGDICCRVHGDAFHPR